MEKKTWTQIAINLPEAYQDLLLGQLASLGFRGFLQEEDLVSCYIPKKAWTPALKKSFEALLGRFENEFNGLRCGWSTSTIKERNWNAAWEKSIGIVEATSKIMIAPSWKKPRKRDKGKIVLRIDPKMAFGTGHHETTRLSLVLLEEYLQPGARVLDLGTGTGVLAIAAAKLGARSAVGVDNDPWALENASENIQRNKVADRVKVRKGEAGKASKSSYDLVVANIDLPTITSSLESIINSLRPQGILIVSGLLLTDLSQFMDLISHRGIVPLEMLSENEWVAVSLTKADASRGN